LELLARGVTGSVRIIDANTGKHRTTVPDIERAARYTVKEGANGPRFVTARGYLFRSSAHGCKATPWGGPPCRDWRGDVRKENI
jgi:hypothetical protein